MSDDVFTGTNANDVFHGGSGNDTVLFAGNAAGYGIEIESGFIVVTDIDASDGDTGIDVLTGIETLYFWDRAYTLQGYSTPSTEGEFWVNSNIADYQGFSAVAALADGGYIISWVNNLPDGSSLGIYAQRYDANGNAVGGETHINTSPPSYQNSVGVTALADGGYIISWGSHQDGSGSGVYAQRYDVEGNAVGVETRINAVTAGNQFAPHIAALANGGYAATWYSNHSGGTYDIYVRLFDAGGNALGTEFRVNTYTANDQTTAEITASQDGGFVIAWSSSLQDGSGSGVYEQRFDASGNRIGGEIQVHTTTLVDQRIEDIVTLDDGGHIIVWLSNHGGNNTDVFTQRYDANGNRVGGETRVNTTLPNYEGDARITALDDGGYVVVWSSCPLDGAWNFEVYAQRFAANGNRVGGETRINTYTNDGQQLPDVAGLPDGGYVVTWTSGLQDGSLSGVYAKRFDAAGQELSSGVEITGTAQDDTIYAGYGIQTLEGLAGNDVLFGGLGNDTLIGGSGSDALAGGFGDDLYILEDNDTVVEDAGAGIDTVRSSVTYTLSDNVENLVLTGSGAINGTGNNQHNTITGNSGKNTLNGGSGGFDTLIGGLGNDTYVLSDADAIVEAVDGGIDTVKAAISYTLGSTLEKLTLTGATAINGTGNALNNTIIGNNGNNMLAGAAGNDTLTGSNGQDVFLFNTALNASNNKDTITDYVVADDSIQLAQAIFSNLATGTLSAANFRANANGKAVDGDDYILYETDTGKLFYDADGNGAGAKVLFAVIGDLTHPPLSATEFTVI